MMNNIHYRNTEQTPSSIIRRILAQKHNSFEIQQKNSKKLVNSLISPQSYFVNCQANRILYEDIAVLNRVVEYLRRNYFLHEYTSKITALSQYYRYERYQKSYLDASITQIMCSNDFEMKKLIRKQLLPNQKSSSLNESSQDQGIDDEKACESNICKGIFDTPKSSVMLGDICDKIGEAFKDFRPKYYHRGTFHSKKQIQKFKKFIRKTEEIREIDVPETHKSVQRQDNFLKTKINKHRSPSTKKQTYHEILHNQQNNPFLHNKNASTLLYSKCNPKQLKLRPRRSKNKLRSRDKNLLNSKSHKEKPKSFSKTTIPNDTISREQGIVYHNQLSETHDKNSPQNRKMFRTKSKTWNDFQAVKIEPKKPSLTKTTTLHRSLSKRKDAQKNPMNCSRGKQKVQKKIDMVKSKILRPNKSEKTHYNGLTLSKKFQVRKSHQKLNPSENKSLPLRQNPSKIKLAPIKKTTLVRIGQQANLQTMNIMKTDHLQNLLKKKLNLRI